jgi:hypothetical protein
MAKITVTVSRRGDARIEVSGVSGASCQDLTRKLEAAIGKTETDIPTAEMFHENSQTQDQ